MGRAEYLELYLMKGKEKGDPDKAEKYLRRAKDAYEEGQFERALNLYSRALSIQISEEALLGQVLSLIELGEYSEAEIWAQKALTVFPSSALIVSARAMAIGRMGDKVKALQISDKAIKLSSDYPFVWIARGDILLPEKLKNALNCFEMALQKGKPEFITYTQIGLCLLFSKKHRESIKYLRKAHEMKPSNTYITYRLAFACERAGLIDEARELYQKLLSFKPNHKPAREAIERLTKHGILNRIILSIKNIFYIHR